MHPAIRVLALALAAMFAALAQASEAPRENFESDRFWLQPYEPTRAGVTSDNDDRTFLDVTLSVKMPLKVLDYMFEMPEFQQRKSELFIAFTGRFSFYWFGRESSPIIGKRFNPKLAWRLTDRRETGFDSCARAGDAPAVPPQAAGVFIEARDYGSLPCGPIVRESYVELSYAHESNGQTVASEAEYRVAQEAALLKDGRIEYADDYISRGWDYLGLTYKPRPCAACENSRRRLSYYANLRYFLDRGVLQGRAEEWNDWELFAARGKKRSEVNGIAVMAKLQGHTCMNDQGRPCAGAKVGDWKLVAGYETGHEKIFRHHTLRLEAGLQVLQLPLSVWWQHGYANDLARYYLKGHSYGIGFDIGSF
ncbi:MAG: hypothetical protein IPH71_05390 [Proteobacteria bacterium]|nr:hypothetical protein [Pseudomonadota bacterium]